MKKIVTCLFVLTVLALAAGPAAAEDHGNHSHFSGQDRQDNAERQRGDVYGDEMHQQHDAYGDEMHQGHDESGMTRDHDNYERTRRPGYGDDHHDRQHDTRSGGYRGGGC